jgi:Fe-S cluster assembly ATP-binding protein
MTALEIRNLYVSVNDKEIIRDFNLTMRQGEIHALMGPNGTGKSTLAYAIMGHPRYQITSGDVLIDGESILGLSSDERAHKGIFLAFQYPVSIPGVSLANFLRVAVNARNKALNPEDRGFGGQVPPAAQVQDGFAKNGLPIRRPIPERRLFGRREKTRGNPADGDVGTSFCCFR